MSDGTTVNAPTVGGGDKIATRDWGSPSGKVPRGALALAGPGSTDGGDVGAANPLPVTGALNPSPATWRQTAAPAAGLQATTTQAAAPALRHICTSITASIACGANASGPVSVFLRDGGAGVGAVLWAGVLSAPVNGSASLVASGLAIPGTAATSMTLEFSGAGPALSLEAVTITGYDG